MRVLPPFWRSLYPELMFWTADSERRRVYRCAVSGATRGRRWKEAGLCLLSTIGVWAVALLYSLLVGHLRAIEYLLSRAPAFWVLPGIVIWIVVCVASERNRVRHLIRAMAVQDGTRLCIACGYDLTGGMTGQCPECGARHPVNPML